MELKLCDRLEHIQRQTISKFQLIPSQINTRLKQKIAIVRMSSDAVMSCVGGFSASVESLMELGG